LHRIFKPAAGSEGRRLIVNTLIVLALLTFVAYWWFGLR
jgi:hypothetical protein